MYDLHDIVEMKNLTLARRIAGKSFEWAQISKSDV